MWEERRCALNFVSHRGDPFLRLPKAKRPGLPYLSVLIMGLPGLLGKREKNDVRRRERRIARNGNSLTGASSAGLKKTQRSALGIQLKSDVREKPGKNESQIPIHSAQRSLLAQGCMVRVKGLTGFNRCKGRFAVNVKIID